MRTEQEIEAKIKELSSDQDNFTTDNYGSEGYDNGDGYHTYFSQWATEETLKRFTNWLLEKK